MPAIDTIASYQGTAGSSFAAGTMASGDPSVVRNFPDAAHARIIGAFYDDVTSAQPWQVRSAMIHDNVRGIRLYPGATAPEAQLPEYVHQRLEAQDGLTFEFSTAASTGKALGALAIYYSQLPGVASRLHSLADIRPLVKSIKPVSVAIGSGANTAGAWYDLAITTTEDLLHANTDYAVLGMTFDQAVACLAIKGTDTGNLRVAVSGTVAPKFGVEGFIRLSQMANLPCIPVINSANKDSTFVSIISSAATGAAGTVQLFLAELSQRLPG